MRGIQMYTGPPPLPEEPEEDDPDFEMTPELMAFADGVWQKAKSEWKIPAGASQIDAPLQAFFAALLEKYNNDLNSLMQRAQTAGENIRLSQTIATVFGRRDWSLATTRKYATNLKRILNLLQFPPGFVDSLRLVPTKGSAPKNKVLGKYGALAADHPIRARLDGWVGILRERTRNRSDLSLRNVVSFYCNACLPALGLNLNEWPEDPATDVIAHVAAHPDTLPGIVGDGPEAIVKAGRLQFLLREILGTDIDVPHPRKKVAAAGEDEDDDGHDVHRISKADLEKLYSEAVKDPRDELLFMIMLTTGLRIGGVARILTRNVAEVKSSQYVIKERGRTKEKGNKFVVFILCEKVRALLHAWLSRHRPADAGPYLFPGLTLGSQISTDAIRLRFHQLCQKCELEGREFHPHALRHTHAHILLECGNSVDAVSKCLNHSSTAVTQKFYLCESAAEVQERCNIPWLARETESEKRQREMNAIPAFLNTATGSTPTTASRARSGADGSERKRRRLEKKEMLKEFGHALSTR